MASSLEAATGDAHESAALKEPPEHKALKPLPGLMTAPPEQGTCDLSLGDPATLWPIATRVLLFADAPRLPPADRLDGPEVGHPSIPFAATFMCVQHPGSAAKAALNDCPHERKAKGAHLAAFVSCIPLFDGPLNLALAPRLEARAPRLT